VLVTRRDEALNKVPAVTLFFWIIKIAAKAVGIRRGAISGNIRLSFQAARSIG
jgi:uncharacterized membrane-anchored protein